jgi:hypothetical protein
VLYQTLKVGLKKVLSKIEITVLSICCAIKVIMSQLIVKDSFLCGKQLFLFRGSASTTKSYDMLNDEKALGEMIASEYN